MEYFNSINSGVNCRQRVNTDRARLLDVWTIDDMVRVNWVFDVLLANQHSRRLPVEYLNWRSDERLWLFSFSMKGGGREGGRAVVVVGGREVELNFHLLAIWSGLASWLLCLIRLGFRMLKTVGRDESSWKRHFLLAAVVSSCEGRQVPR